MRRVAMSLVFFACSSGGTDTGNPHDGSQTDEGDTACEQSEHQVELDEVSALGFSVQDALAWLAGPHHERLLWTEENNPSLGPEHGLSDLTLDIEPLGARFVSRTSRNGLGPYQQLVTPHTSLADSFCHDSIVLDVSMHISTAGGALAETVQTSLELRAADFATGQVVMRTDSLTGTFHADLQLPPGFVGEGVPKLVLDLRLSGLGSTGQLSMVSDIVSSDGQATGQGGAGILAHFPAGGDCPTGAIAVAPEHAIRGVSVASVLQQLNASSPVQLDGSSASIELKFEGNPSSLCAILDVPEVGAIEFPGSVTLRSSDQQIDGKIEVILSGQTLAGVQSRSGASADTAIPDSAGAAEEARRYAIRQPLDFSAYDGGAFRFSAQVTDDVAVGELRADGVHRDDCGASRSASSSDGQSTSPSSGCMADKPLWFARWSRHP